MDLALLPQEQWNEWRQMNISGIAWATLAPDTLKVLVRDRYTAPAIPELQRLPNTCIAPAAGK